MVSNVMDSEHLKWLEARVKEAKMVKIGMPRTELLMFFREKDGGIKTRLDGLVLG